jgi:hypothetical protein
VGSSTPASGSLSSREEKKRRAEPDRTTSAWQPGDSRAMRVFHDVGYRLIFELN